MFDKLLEQLSTEIAQRIIQLTEAKLGQGLAGKNGHAAAALAAAPRRRGRPPKNPSMLALLSGSLSAKAAKKPKMKRDMHCRVEGCKLRSKGPGFGYMCEEHLKLPKAEQRRAQEAYRLKLAEK
jgi:hypothetical protein